MTGTARLDRWTTGGTALLLAAALGACTSDDAGGDATQAAETSTSESGRTDDPPAAPTSAADSGDVGAFCDAIVALEASIAVDLEVADRVASPQQRADALAAWNATLRQQLNVMEDNTPEQASEDVEALSSLVHEALTFGSLTAAQEEEAATVDDNLDEYRLAECGYQHVEATGIDFAYEGLPATVPPGVVAITFTNQGDEPHEIFLARLNDNVTMSVDQVMALPEEQAFSMIAPVGRSSAMPGDSETTFIRMGPGRYGVACLIPQGTTPDTEGSGPLHVALGEFAEFTVQ
jgi:hypothetical protein